MSNIRKFIASLGTEERELLDLLLEEEGVGVSNSLIIPQQRGAAFFPLSFAQERLWFLNHLTDESTAYNGSSAFRLKNKISLESLEQAFTEIVRRHDVLRTTFHSVDGRPVQIISPPAPVPMQVIDLCEIDLHAREAAIHRLIREELSTPFDLSKDLLFRAMVLRLDEDDHVVISSMHHIACDGWSAGIYVTDLAALYDAFSQGRPSPLPDLPIRYVDFAVWQREQLNGELLQKQLDYWRKQLADVVLLQMPTDRPRPAVQTYSGAAQAVELDRSLIDGLENLSRRYGVTMFMTLLAAFKILLYRYSGQEDIVVGSLIAGRNRIETEGLVGFFANGLALRTDLSGDPTFEELLLRVQQVARGAYAHQDLPFERVIEELNPERDLSHTPLFQVVFQYDITPASDIQLPGLILQPIEIDTDTVQYDLILDLGQSDQELFGEIVYNTDLFDAATIERLMGHLRRVLYSVVEEPRRRLSEVPMLTAEEQAQLLVEWNETRCDYPDDKCFHQLFEEQVERTPDAIAAVFENEQLTYSELNRRANKVARYLRNLGVTQETMVGICLERSLEMAVGLMGIFKSQGVYIPLDPVYPRDRLAFMLEDSDVSVLLTQKRLINDLPRSSAWALCLDTDWSTIDQQGDGNLSLESCPDSLAYGYYTSGSTGRPKGVLISNRALVNYLVATAQHFELNAEDRILQFASFGFDVVVEELFTTWMTGAAVVFQNPEAWSSPRRLLNTIEQYLITALELPAAFFHELVYEVSVTETMLPESLRLMLVGCEKPSSERLALWQKFGKPLIYVFGLTETAVTSTLFRFDTDTPNIRTGLPIGKPIANTQIYLLDAHRNPVPVGVPAELYIGGTGLGRGYLGNADTTAEKFVPDPFSSQPGERLYKTGDMARYLPDGNIDFLGRLDNQVKLRGYRIELGEIETVLGQHPHVREVVTLVREDNPGDKRLVAYIVAAQETRCDGHDLNRAYLTASDLRSFLRERLPEYMVPAFFVILDTLPLTSNGKVDYQALPQPDQTREDAEETQKKQKNPFEEILAGIWAEVFGLDEIGIHDNFFNLGGHSLLALQVVSRVRHAFQIDLPQRSLFESPTVAELAERIEAAMKSGRGLDAPPVTPALRSGDLPLSFAQQRLWFIEQLEPGNYSYNIPEAVRLKGMLNLPALVRTLTEIVRRHESLRTTFSMVEGRPVQRIHPSQSVSLPIIDLTELAADIKEGLVQQLASEEVQIPFDLTSGPLLRVTMLKLDEHDHAVLLTLHHIVGDPWSMEVLVRELAALYQAFSKNLGSPLPELPIQYADFTLWQRQWLQGEVLEKQLAYWRQNLSGRLPQLKLRTDRPRPATRTYKGAAESFTLPVEVTASLHALSREAGVTVFMTTFAIFQTLLHRYSGQDDIIVGSGIANRTRTETEQLIGYFVNTLVLRSDLSGNPTFKELLGRVKEMMLGAYAHQDLPFELLVEALQPERMANYNPLFQVWCEFQPAPVDSVNLPGLQLSPLRNEWKTAQFDLLLSLFEYQDTIQGFLVYSTDLFDSDTIVEMLERYVAILEAVSSNPELRLLDIPLTKQDTRKYDNAIGLQRPGVTEDRFIFE